jgi:oligoribonuclease NrnB/cAMP/cGMP phosphodiesterase (DHH superfamily)
MRPNVLIVSHGPHCLDGVTAAAAVARFYGGEAETSAAFAANSEIDRVLQAIRPPTDRPTELWITDISWREAATDAHLRGLAASGVHIYWIDHHRTALERVRKGLVDVPFTGSVLSEEFAASRLVYDYLARRADEDGRPRPQFRSFRPTVAMADDNDRWLHQIPGSRELGWVVRALGPDAYPDFLTLDERVTYTPRMTAARDRVGAEIAHSFEVAERSRVERRLGDVTLVAAVCDGYTSEVADAWGKKISRAVFALYDAKGLAVSFRRSPDCTVDLSQLAQSFGGGGHAAASGCELPELRTALASLVADTIASAIKN